MKRDTRRHAARELSMSDIEEGLRKMPDQSARPEFRDRLRDDLRAQAAQVLAPQGRRAARRAGRRASAWRRVVAVAGLAAMLAIAALAGSRVYDRYEIARLPKLPPTVQELVGAGGRYAAVKEATYSLTVPLPAAPRRIRTYLPRLSPYTLAEANGIAAAIGIKGPADDMQMMWRFADHPDKPWTGRLLDIQQPEPRVSYFSYSPGSGAQISDQQAIAAAKAFLQEARLPYAADSVSIQAVTDRPEYEIHLVQRLGGYDALGFETAVWVYRSGGTVASAYTIRVSYEPGPTYPIKTAAQAYDDLKRQTVYAEHDRINVRIDAVRLAYYNYPRRDVPSERTVMQPVYVFTGVDNYGQPFQAYVPAVPAQFIETVQK